MSKVPKKRKNTFTRRKFCCNICCKYFTTKSSHTSHMKICHDDDAISKTPNSNDLFKPTYKTTNVKYWSDPTDIFIEYFENQLSSEFQNGFDKFRCFSCHIKFENETEYMKHEITHYCLPNVNNNFDVNQEKSFQKNVKYSLMTDNFNGTKCAVCKKMFTTMSDFNEHINKNCKSDEHIKHVNLIKSKENIKLKKKKTLKSKCVPQKFNCFVCKQMCDILEHLELSKWWAGSETINEFRCYECDICYEQFFEEKKFRIHQNDHVEKNIC